MSLGVFFEEGLEALLPLQVLMPSIEVLEQADISMVQGLKLTKYSLSSLPTSRAFQGLLSIILIPLKDPFHFLEGLRPTKRIANSTAFVPLKGLIQG